MANSSLQEIIRRRTELSGEISKRVGEHAAYLKTSSAELDDLSKREAALIAGLDVARIDRARSVLVIVGQLSKIVHAPSYREDRSHVRVAAVEDAKRELANGGGSMKDYYIGVKNYAGFGDQREDHRYGFGPKHGSIVFEVALTTEARTRELTATEIEDALYLLSVLPQFESVAKAAA